ncbi:MAG: sulfatase-like hydrolase/transferase, partial [Myxococcota bacterium]
MAVKPPNILWICTDQQRFDSLSCAGHPWIKTPRLDRLAEQGVRLTHAVCQSPVCTPSRASFMTGRYPRTTRCRQNGQAIPADEQVVTRLLKEGLGYGAGLAGKLHLSPANPSACPTTERRIDDGYDVFQWSHHPDPDWPTNAYIHWLRERGVTYATTPFQGSRYVREGMKAEHHQTTWCAQMAIGFIEASAHFERPWIYTINTFDPHHPFDPPRTYLDRHLDRLDQIALPNTVPGELDTKPVFQRLDHMGAYHNPELYPYAA